MAKAIEKMTLGELAQEFTNIDTRHAMVKKALVERLTAGGYTKDTPFTTGSRSAWVTTTAGGVTFDTKALERDEPEIFKKYNNKPRSGSVRLYVK